MKTHRLTRYLGTEELSLFWWGVQRADAPPAIKHALQLLLITGVRAGALCTMRWEHVDFAASTWAFKGRSPHIVRDLPAPAEAISILRDLRTLANGAPHVLSTSAGALLRPLSLTRVLRRIFSEGQEAHLPGGAITVHDLRRTVATHLFITLQVPRALVYACLDMRYRDITFAEAGHLDMDDVRAPLEAWVAYLERQLTTKKK